MEQGGEGYARRIAFEGIIFVAVNNPITIDQFYCPSKVNCKNDVRKQTKNIKNGNCLLIIGISDTSLVSFSRLLVNQLV